MVYSECERYHTTRVDDIAVEEGTRVLVAQTVQFADALHEAARIHKRVVVRLQYVAQVWRALRRALGYAEYEVIQRE